MNTTPNHMKSPTNIDFQSHNDSKIVATSQSLGKAISNAKKARQDAELKSHLLSNRIALLQHEESKIICKINETKKKTYDLYKIKKNNEEWKNLVILDFH